MFFILLFAAICGLVPLLSQLDFASLYDLGILLVLYVNGTLFLYCIYESNKVQIVQSTCTYYVQSTSYIL
jgi:hypothetical protein